MLLEKSGEITRKNEVIEPKSKQHPVVDVIGDGNKVQAIKNNIA